jgi:hypothetical protein
MSAAQCPHSTRTDADPARCSQCLAVTPLRVSDDATGHPQFEFVKLSYGVSSTLRLAKRAFERKKAS